ncbi:MAG TPA: DUF1007 family protein [Alphaproteobacteria bacterium]|nr:DUF1007 family protein [Alphaproteobacteria bacterium]
MWKPPLARHLRLFVATMLCAGLPSVADAHPHAWIDVTVDVLFNASGRVTGLHERWLLDEYYSAYVTAGYVGRNGQTDHNKMAALLQRSMKNLAEYTYFTKVTTGSVAVPFAAIEDASAQMRGRRLELAFLLPLAAPANVNDEPLVYSIYDPTYYVEVLHADRRDAIQLVDAPRDCHYRLIPPKPSIESVMRAQSLDVTQTSDDSLGQLFAQKVNIRCGAPP